MRDDERNTNLDVAVDLVKAHRPSESDIANAAKRVHELLMSQENSPSSAGLQLNSIDDYIAAIPSYLDNDLTPAQTTLFEEESRQSIPLRRALNAARQPQVQNRMETQAPKAPVYRWLASAAAIAVIAISVMLVVPELPSFDQTRIAQVAEIGGDLYQVADGRLNALTPGTWIDGQQDVRTGKGSTAILILDDGSRVEVAGRSQINVTRRLSGNRINVERGRIIVAASPQGSGTLDVGTNEFIVSVTGTIFEVGHGAMGSRVAVIEGEVQVNQHGASISLMPGEQLSSRTGFSTISFDDEIAWSRNADLYIEMLKEVSALQKDIQAAMATEPRYSTRLLGLAPVNTAIYVGVPNAPEKITEIYDLMSARMQQSPGLAAVWSDVERDENHHMDKVMTWLRGVGENLGDETVATISLQVTEEGDYEAIPVILSEVDAAAFASTFETQIEQLHETWSGTDQYDDFRITLIDDPSDAVTGELSVWLHEDLLVASISPKAIQEVQSVLVDGTSAFVESGFYELLQHSYDQGAEFLGAIDLARIVSTRDLSRPEMDVLGLSNAQYLIAERRHQGEFTSVVIELQFDGETTGMMSWLAAPGPMGSLEFFSADATIAAAFVVKDPSTIVYEMRQMALAHRSRANADADLDLDLDLDEEDEEDEGDVHLEFDVGLVRDVIANLGGEVAFGLDGPTLPTPAWKVIIEVYNEQQLQRSIERAVTGFNKAATESDKKLSVAISAADVGPYPGYQIRVTAEADNPSQASLPEATWNYAYVDGYLVAAPNEVLVDRAISHYQGGTGLLTDHEFRSLLPQDGYLDFSAVAFNRVSELVESMLQHMPNALTTEQQQTLADLGNESGPSMYSVYGNPGSIRFVQNGSGLSFSLSQLLSLQTILSAANGQISFDELPDDAN